MSLKGGFMDLERTNRTVLVTGSYRGTGLIIAKHFLNEGCRVFVHGLVSGQAEKAVAEIGGGDPAACTFGPWTTSASDESDPSGLIDRHLPAIVRAWQRLAPAH